MQTIQSLLSNPQYPYKKVLEKLIAHRLGQDIPRVLAHLDREMFATDIQWIQTSYDQYAIHKEPLEYILGYVAFLGYRFSVNRHTLIPRPETEYMISAVVTHIQNSNIQHTLIDVGTGCGVLGISSILHAGQYLDQVYLTDYYEQTLQQAQTNLKQYQEIVSKNPTLSRPVRNHVQTFHCSLLDHPVLTSVISDQQSIIIVANLPYIPEQLFEHNVEDNVKLREPKAAFVGGEDGLDRYRQMLDQIIATRNQNKEIRDRKGENRNENTENSPSKTIKLNPDNTQSANPQSANPQSANPQSANPQSANPQSANPQSANPQSANPQSANPQSANSQSANPQSVIRNSLILFLEMMTRQVKILTSAYKNHFQFEEVATFHMNIRIVKATSLL